MLIIKLILGPIVGGVIGGITNKIAIKMLFSPYEAKYIGKMHVPFTPGIIPKEKSRIARAVGEAVSRNLLDAETMSQTLLSDDMMKKVSDRLDGVLYGICNSQQSIREFAVRYLDEKEIDIASEKLEQRICHAICNKLSDEAIGENIADVAIRHVQDKLSGSILGGIGSVVLETMKDSAKRLLADNINEMLRKNAPEMVENMVKGELHGLQDKPISELFATNAETLARIKEVCMKIYKSLITNNLPKILETINIQKIIEDRLNAMDMAETERLIISIMDKELKALVWFGVALGFVMGFLTDLMFLVG
ncbi:MAG: DUF445 family protein [Bacteroidales bacterium]|nr:DUF445 family protein [Bacteroidales bacterium]